MHGWPLQLPAQRATIFQVGCNPSGTEGVVANPRLDAGGYRPPTYHAVGVRLRDCSPGQQAALAADGSKQRPLGGEQWHATSVLRLMGRLAGGGCRVLEECVRRRGETRSSGGLREPSRPLKDQA
jgi:hypothetical protein